jgi:hypothetical protein
MSSSNEILLQNLNNVNNKGKILTSITLTMINTLLLLLFFYNLFSSSYLPQQGTGILLSIIVGCALIFIFINIFIKGFSVNGKSILDVFFKNNPIKGLDNESKMMSEILIFRIFNSLKMLFIVAIGTALSVMFFKYYEIIDNYHSKIPSFDMFFNLTIFSLLAQSVYLSTGHFVYNTNTNLKDYFGTTTTSFLGFTLLNIITILFVVSMWTELVFSITNG